LASLDSVVETVARAQTGRGGYLASGHRLPTAERGE